MLLRLTLASGLMIGLSGGAFAQVGTDEALNACIGAAKQQHQGLLTGWEIKKGDAGGEFEISMLAPDDRRWKMVCRDGKIVGEDQRLGTKDYEMLSGRKSVPEVSARATATVVYGGSTMHKMTYGLSWLGKPYYHYFLTTDDGRSAQVDVNAETGQIDSTRSERGSSWW